MNPNVQSLGRKLYLPNLKDAAWLEDAQLIFQNLHTFLPICLQIWLGRRGSWEKKLWTSLSVSSFLNWEC